VSSVLHSCNVKKRKSALPVLNVLTCQGLRKISQKQSEDIETADVMIIVILLKENQQPTKPLWQIKAL